MKVRVGWWVHFLGKTAEGEDIEGFFIDDKRNEKFHLEPGFLPNVVFPCWVDIPEPSS